LVEIYQNCNIFNDGAFDLVKNPESRDEALIRLTAGAPIVFGDRRVVRDTEGHLHVAHEGEPVIHDPTDLELAFALSRLSGTELDHTPIGIFRDVTAPTYGAAVRGQIADSAGDADLQSLLTGPDPWAVN
jgi:2-oxoglutarate ferredoxin oxidoreductase subunit beta